MKILLLTGGASKRLWPLTGDKNLWPFYAHSLFSYHLQTLHSLGLGEIVVVINPKSQQAAQELTQSLGIPVTFAVQTEANGMGQAVVSAKAALGNDSVLILNTDDVLDPNLLSQIQKIDQSTKLPTLVGKVSDTYFDGGYFQVEGRRATGIIEKPGEGNEPSNLIKLVADYFPQASGFVQAIETAQTEGDDQYEVALSAYLKANQVEVLAYEGQWLTVKYPWHLLQMMAFFFKDLKEPKIAANAQISPQAIIEGPVVIEDGVKIFENAKIRGPVYLGKNVVVANNALVRESYIGPGSVVGFASEVARSYLGPDCWTHNNFVGDSVLEANVSFGVGTVLTNLKLDESAISSVVKGNKVNSQMTKLGAIIGKNVRIGSNATLMPGVKIGSGSFVGAGVLVTEDLEGGQFLTVKQEQIKRVNNKSAADLDRSGFKGKI